MARKKKEVTKTEIFPEKSETDGSYFIKIPLPTEQGREYEEGEPVCVSSKGNKIVIDFNCSHNYVKKE